MYDIMQRTAWKMTPPPAYGTFHLIFLIGGILTCILLAFLLRKSKDRTIKRVLFGIGVFLLVTEVYKQLFYTYCSGGGKYQWWIFPFQLCSVPMYLCLLLPFIKNERVTNWFYLFLTTYNLLGGFVSLFEPSGLSHEYWTLTLHAYVWHLLLVFIGFYLIACKKSPEKVVEDFPKCLIMFFYLCGLATFFNIVFRDKGVRMFYISPFHSNPIIVFKDIERVCGFAVGVVVYVAALSIGAFIFCLISCLINRLRQKYTIKKYW